MPIGIYDEITEDEKGLYVKGRIALKTRAGAEAYELLKIGALDGRPGVYSARYAREQCIAEDNIQKVLAEMKGQENRDACFRTIISLVIDGKEFQFEGMVEGQIIPEKWGDKGFGYDPIFLADGFDESFAQMSIQQKNEISHRGLAVKELIAFLKKKV